MPTKFLLFAGASVLALGLAAPAFADPPEDKKVPVCHVPPGNPEQAHVINVGVAAATKGHNVDGEADPDRKHLDPEGVGGETGCVAPTGEQ